MPVTDSQLEIIFRYFDGELSPDEEARLMQQLQQDSDLQKAFDQQIMMQQFTPEETALQLHAVALESAEVFLNKVSDTVENKRKPAPVIALPKRKSGWQIAAAVVAVGLLAALMYYLFIIPKTTGNNLVKKPAKDSSTLVNTVPQQPKTDPPVEPNVKQNDSALLYQLYTDNRSSFHSDENSIPIADQEYWQLYEKQRYKELAAKNENELAVKGENDPEEEQLTLSYFWLYKGLANLELNKLAQAEKLFNKLIQPGVGNKQLQYVARWNLLLLYLKEGNKDKAMQMADSLAGEKGNPYHKQAAAIQTALHK